MTENGRHDPLGEPPIAAGTLAAPQPGGLTTPGSRSHTLGLRVGASIVGGAVLLALLAPLIAPADPNLQGALLTERLLSPSWTHLLGTDHFARDVLSRLLYGARISLMIGVGAVMVSALVGIFIGSLAGFLGGKVDAALMRFVDMILAFPRLVLLIVLVALFEPSLGLIVLVIGLTQWPNVARLVRGEVLSLRQRDFVTAARVLGIPESRILIRHILPNALPPVFVIAALGVGRAILLEAGLSYLGIGIQPPAASWGSMIADGRNYLLDAWWLSTFPGLAIVAVVIGFNLLGDGLRDRMDPNGVTRNQGPGSGPLNSGEGSRIDGAQR